MVFEPAGLIAAVGVVTVAVLARRDAAAAALTRQNILASAVQAVDAPFTSHDAAGYPMINGQIFGDDVRVRLIPDTMTIRRLPQLWVEVTVLNDLVPAGQGLAILVRPSGADFYSLTPRMPALFDPPAGFPDECLIKGQSTASRETLESLAPVAANILQDRRVKEIAVTNRGSRIVRQLAEGRRGEHLVLRRSVFDDAHMTACDLTALFTALRQIDHALRPMKHQSAA